ncbi:zinc ribbon domain-containing protein [Methanobacterium alcaliphilum]|uniref:zinc ribbon domain-containing protein n=1 Tax=Methanobacterium alcaliphilum TaxID=392018 RepID=UPI00200A1495|nr:zinc-ribbon domain-containing protein [Methanobacterium alcaliphilum]MCK9151414.1 zinc-ribbon domain-containing protein [Methanobacterium alcaliphilum]
MVYCSNCGERNKNSAKYCSNCGTHLRSNYPPKSYSSKPQKPRSTGPSKPLQSQFKSRPYNRSETLNREIPVEKSRYQMESVDDGIEWNVVIIGAMILVIIASILNIILPQISFWIAAVMAIVYALMATKRSSTLFFIIPLILLVSLALWAFFNG